MAPSKQLEKELTSMFDNHDPKKQNRRANIGPAANPALEAESKVKYLGAIEKKLTPGKIIIQKML